MRVGALGPYRQQEPACGRRGALCEADSSGAIVREYRDELHHRDAYHNGDSRVLYTVAQQHCLSELPDGSLLLFDNGTFRTRESVTYSRVIEVDKGHLRSR
jgi:hypothetical protein